MFYQTINLNEHPSLCAQTRCVLHARNPGGCGEHIANWIFSIKQLESLQMMKQVWQQEHDFL